MDAPHYVLLCDDGPDILGAKRVARVARNVRVPVIAEHECDVPPGLLRMTRAEFYDWSRETPDRIPTAARCITCWTDGSWIRETSRGGFGAIIFDAMHDDIRCEAQWGSSPHDVPITNIRAEAYGILAAMRYTRAALQGMEIKFGVLCTVITDSEFWINMMTAWVPKWSEAKRSKCRNADLVAEMWGAMQAFRSDGVEIVFRFIPSHDKRGWLANGAGALRLSTALNNAVDSLASHHVEGQWRAVVDHSKPFDLQTVVQRGVPLPWPDTTPDSGDA